MLRGLPAGIAWPLLPACRRGAELTVHPSGPGPRPRRMCLSTDSHLAVYKDCFWVFGVVIRLNTYCAPPADSSSARPARHAAPDLQTCHRRSPCSKIARILEYRFALFKVRNDCLGKRSTNWSVSTTRRTVPMKPWGTMPWCQAGRRLHGRRGISTGHSKVRLSARMGARDDL